MAKILLVSLVRELVEGRDKLLRAAGYDVTLTMTYTDALQAAEQQAFDVAVLDIRSRMKNAPSLPK